MFRGYVELLEGSGCFGCGNAIELDILLYNIT